VESEFSPDTPQDRVLQVWTPFGLLGRRHITIATTASC
jgi:hypothetical protein